MAIKINWKDLSKRIIDGVEVEKVMLNGVQIRPDSPVPPTPFIPDGFHMATIQEWQTFLSYMSYIGAIDISSSAWATSMGAFIYLKIPPIWYINSANNSITLAWESAILCTPYSIFTYEAWRGFIIAHTIKLYTNSWYSVSIFDSTANWYSIRLTKDVAVQPDSSWVTLWTSTTAYQWGIYWNPSLWLITLSYKSTGGGSFKYITIQDKNLWATTVYDYDIMWTSNIDSDCIGGLYQWGNCHGFEYGWDYETSTTLVDASWYRKYEYSSDVFIINNWYPTYWQQFNESTYNNNLW